MTREEAWNRIDAIIARHEIDDDYVTITSVLDYDALRMARKALEQNESAEEWYKLFVEKLEQEPKVLDKIRAEIETKYGQCDICEYFEDYDYEENDISEYRPIGGIADILQIIDKYRNENI